MGWSEDWHRLTSPPPPSNTHPSAWPWSRLKAASLPSLLCPFVDPQLGAAMRGDWWPIVIYVLEGSPVRMRAGGGGKDGSRVRPKETTWLQPSTSFHLHLQHSPLRSFFDSQCRHGEMKLGEKPGDLMVEAQTGRQGVHLDMGKIKNWLRGMMRPRQKEITLCGGMSQIWSKNRL